MRFSIRKDDLCHVELEAIGENNHVRTYKEVTIIVLCCLFGGCSLFQGSEEENLYTDRASLASLGERPITKNTRHSAHDFKKKQKEIKEFVEKQPSSPSVYPQEDRELLAKIRRALMDNEELSFKAKNIHIAVSNSDVQLTGAVESEQERQRIKNLTRELIGDRDLKTKLVIYDGWF